MHELSQGKDRHERSATDREIEPDTQQASQYQETPWAADAGQQGLSIQAENGRHNRPTLIDDIMKYHDFDSYMAALRLTNPVVPRWQDDPAYFWASKRKRHQ